MKTHDIPASVLGRRALVYVRQSTGIQVKENQESQRRQYELAQLARSYGFTDIQIIDSDLGKSAGGTAERPGFESVVAQLCQGAVGAVFCLEASRIARNGREWHHLVELCGLVDARVVDSEGIYDPTQPNDRLLLGLKGTMSEFELTLLRSRLVEGARAKAARGELRTSVPVGYVWAKDGLELDPDRRVQESIRCVFRLFEQLGSARQVHKRMCRDRILFPRASDGHQGLRNPCWRLPGYRNVIALLQNPFYAGAYAYGKSGSLTSIVDGRPQRRSRQKRPMEQWGVLLRDHHEGYISWAKFEHNQTQIAKNAFRKRAGDPKSGRGGRALLSGLLRCARCGRMLAVAYGGRCARYSCRMGYEMHGTGRCISFGALRPDQAIATEIMRVVQPLSVEAALVAEQQITEVEQEKVRSLELELQQAKYESQLARRRYEAVDPDNRLVASELESRWNEAMAHIRRCEERFDKVKHQATAEAPTQEELLLVAENLEAAWVAPTTDMKAKQRLVRTLIQEIVADVEVDSEYVALLIHWRGGQHTKVRVRKAKSGEHSCRTPDEADAVIKEMATKWSDEHIAASLNRMGLRTAQGKTWNVVRVGSYRRTHGIHGYASAVKDGKYLTMYEASKYLGVSMYKVRRLIEEGVLSATQVVKDAPWQILCADLDSDPVRQAARSRLRSNGRPFRQKAKNQNLMIPGT